MATMICCRWEGICFSAKVFCDAPALRDSMDGKKIQSPFPHGDSPYRNGEAGKKNDFGTSRFHSVFITIWGFTSTKQGPH